MLLDVSASLALGVRISREADWSELKWMIPTSLIGAVLGVTLLVNLPRQATLVALGSFLVAYAIYAFRQGGAVTMLGRHWAPVAGSRAARWHLVRHRGPALRHLPVAAAEGTAGVPRHAVEHGELFGLDPRARVCRERPHAGRPPGRVRAARTFRLAGLWLGNRIQGRFSRDILLRIVSVLLLLIGVSLIVRAVS